MSCYINTARATSAGVLVMHFTSWRQQPSLAYASNGAGAGPVRKPHHRRAQLRLEGLSNTTGTKRLKGKSRDIYTKLAIMALIPTLYWYIPAVSFIICILRC